MCKRTRAANGRFVGLRPSARGCTLAAFSEQFVISGVYGGSEIVGKVSRHKLLITHVVGNWQLLTFWFCFCCCCCCCCKDI